MPLALGGITDLTSDRAAQIEDVKRSEVFFETLAHAVHSRRVDPAGIGHETNHAAVGINSIAGPADRLDVAVIQRIFVGGVGVRGVSLGNAKLEIRIRLILCVVIGRALPDRVGRIADDHLNIGRLLMLNPRGILQKFATEKTAVIRLVILTRLKRVGETDARERHVEFIADARVKCIFDVDASHVIGKQNDLIGENLIAVLVMECGIVDEFLLDHARDESAGAGEWIENVDSDVGESSIKIRAENVLHGIENEVDDLERRVDNAESFGGFVERDLEEFIVELDDDLLPIGRILNVGAPLANRFVNAVELFVVFIDGSIVEEI